MYNPFLIYIPIKGFIKPIIFNENKIKKQSDQRIRDYFTYIIKYDPYHDYSIFLTELLMDYYTNFMYSDYVKFRDYIDSAKYNFIKDSKFKSVSTFILPRLSERIAQNERTIFTFITDK